MIGYGHVHLVVGPVEKIDNSVANTLAAILKKDVYQARQLLSGNIPKVIANYRSAEEAEAVTNALRSMGLVAFTCEDTVLRRPPPLLFNVSSMSFNESGVALIAANKASTTLTAGSVFLILKGYRQTVVEVDNTGTKRKLSVGKTLLAGGIPIFDKVKNKDTTRSSQDELYLRLYDSQSADPRVEISQHNLDYKFLGPKLTLSSTVNFSTVVNDFKNCFTGAIFDDRLARMPSHSESPLSENELELNCRLLYLYYKNLRRSQETR